MAAKGGHLTIVRQLLQCNADPNPSRVSHTGSTRPRCISALTHRHVAAVRAAALYGHEAVLECLLSRRADPDAPSLCQRTALMGAAMNGHASCVQLLLQAGAVPSTRNDHGETALDLAVTQGHSAAIEYLQQAQEPVAATPGPVECSFCGSTNHAYFECDTIDQSNLGAPDTLQEFCGMTGDIGEFSFSTVQ